MSETPEPIRWVTVASSNPWHAELQRTLLEESGIPVFFPDHTTKIVDPFITGANPLETRVQVPAEQAEAAERLLAEAERGGRLGGPEASEGGAQPPADDEDEEARAEHEADELSWLSRRARWSAILWLTSPLAILYGVGYLREAHRQGRRDPHHGLVWAAILFGLLNVAVVVWWLAGGLDVLGR